MERTGQQSRYPNIDAERARMGLTYEELASYMGVTRKTIYNWIKDGRIPHRSLEMMSRLFGRDIDYLLGRTAN